MSFAIIVDAYRLSKDYIAYLNAKNIQCIHIQSTKKPIEKMQPFSSYHELDYSMSLVFEGNFAILWDFVCFDWGFVDFIHFVEFVQFIRVCLIFNELTRFCGYW